MKKTNLLLMFPAVILLCAGLPLKAGSISSAEISTLTGSAQNHKTVTVPSQAELLKMNQNISPSVMEKIKVFIQTKLSDFKNNAQLLALLAKLGVNHHELIGESLNQAFNEENPEEAFNSLNRLLNQIQQNPEIQRQIQASPGYQTIEKQLNSIFSEMDKSIDNF